MNKADFNNESSGWRVGILSDWIIECTERNIRDEGYPVYSVTNTKGFVLQTDHFAHSIHSKETTKYKIFHKNEFGYNPARINVGSIALNEENLIGLLSPMYTVFKTKPGLIARYLKYWIETTRFRNHVINNTVGSVRESLNFSSFKYFPFKFPESIIEQTSITEILAACDKATKTTAAKIEKLKRIKQGLMQDLFRYGIDDQGEMRSELTNRYKDSPLGRIPEEWQVKDILYVANNIFLGLTSKVDYVDRNGIPLIRATDIADGQLSFENVLSISKRQHESLTKYRKVKRGDILVSKSGSLGVCALVNADIEFSIYESIIAVQPNVKCVNSRFLIQLLRYIPTQERMIGQQVGSTVGHLNLITFRKLKLAIPTSLREQEAISNVLDEIDNLISMEARMFTKLISLKTGLMEDLLSGTVLVNQLVSKQHA